jgi:hypothetical protein
MCEVRCVHHVMHIFWVNGLGGNGKAPLARRSIILGIAVGVSSIVVSIIMNEKSEVNWVHS